MSKVKSYIEEAVKATAAEITTKGVELSNISIDNGTHIHNDNMAAVLMELAKAQSVIANAVASASKALPSVNQDAALKITGITEKPVDFRVSGETK